MNVIIAEKLKLLPDTPGVYKMMDGAGQVIYVGKAVNLKNRVRQYFRAASTLTPKVAAMVSHAVDFEYILTANETEALTLESNLIKQFQPRYNILLKDDKHFPYVRVNLKKPFARFEVVRRVKNDGARYFGPYLSGLALRDSLNAIRDYFPVRHCKKDIQRAIDRGERPCLMYHLGKCCAPCSGSVSPEAYRDLLDQICAFLDGRVKPLIERLTGEMQEASARMDFERAAQLRDRIRAIDQLGRKQQAIDHQNVERDVFALALEGDSALVFAMFIRGGKVIGTERFDLTGAGESRASLMASFIKQYYARSGYVPEEIAVKDMMDDRELIEAWLSEKRGKKTRVICPQRGDKLKQVQLAYDNGMEVIRRERELQRREWERGEGALAQLCEIAGLSNLPERMECYDNSHIQGMGTVGAMVVFINGKPAPKEYRRFRIRGLTEGDDYKAMGEVLKRRLDRAAAGDEKFAKLPDLLIVDGGRGQLNVALEALDNAGCAHIPAIGLAERSETVILPDNPEPITLDRHSPALHLLERIRDEAHRFAITYHRSLRARSALYSVLDEIEGVGPKRKRELFNAFLTLEAIQNADEEELRAVPGMNREAARKVYAYFNSKKAHDKE